jgi:hypothetical protein
MTFVRSLSKFVQEAFPLVIATVISAILVLALYLSSGSAQPQRESSDATAEPIVYIAAMPHISRDPTPVTVAAIPPANAETVTPAETPATTATPVAAVQPTEADAVIPIKPHSQTAIAPAARERAARTTVAIRANASVTPKAEPAAKVEPVVARIEPAVANVEPAPTLAPPMPIPPMQIVNAEAQTLTPEPTRIFGMTVPAPVVNVGGKVVGAARFPIEVAEVAVPSPVVRVGLRIVEKVAGAAGAAISDFGR